MIKKWGQYVLKIGYIRSSYYLENDKIQSDNLQQEKLEKIFRDNLERSKDKREQFEAMMDFAREGDTIITYDMTRVADSLQSALKLVEDLNNNGIDIKFIKEQIDTSSPAGTMKLNVYREVLEFEEAARNEYRKEGIAKGKKKGNYTGRKKMPLPKNWDEVYIQYIQKNISHTTAMNALGMKRTRFFDCVRHQKQLDLDKAEELKKQHLEQIKAIEKVDELTNNKVLYCSSCGHFIDDACNVNARSYTFENAKACERYI